MSVQVVRVGLRNTAVAVPVGPGATNGPITVGGRPSLGQLADVAGTATAPLDTPLVLRRGNDGIYRPEPLGQHAQRGSVVHYVDEPPLSSDPSLQVGDFYRVIGTADLYEVQETP